MTKVRMLPGRLLIVKDPDINMQRGLHVPDVSVVRACTGLVLMHEPRALENMYNRRIIYAKFSETPFPVEGLKGLFTITEDCVMAVFEEEK
jgi:hypothetical protein